jgi:hypothetical protein
LADEVFGEFAVWGEERVEGSGNDGWRVRIRYTKYIDIYYQKALYYYCDYGAAGKTLKLRRAGIMWWDKRPEWLDELGASIKELSANLKVFGADMKELSANLKEFGADMKELDAKLASMAEDSKRRDDELRARIAAVTLNVNGISDSNGMFAEEFFFNTLSKKKEFAGIHFDEVEDDVGNTQKQPGGKRLKDQFDILMTNAASAAIVEVKYRARKDDVGTLVGRKLKNFKILLPEYSGLKIYLGLAALAFEDDAVEEARKYGVGLLQQVGETVEYAADWEVKAY